MKVVWATDQNYLKPTLVSILSLLEHASRSVAVHVMGHGLSGAALDLLARVETAHPGTTFAHIPLDGDMFDADRWDKERDHWSPLVLARLRIPQFFESGRVLHLDSDTLVLGDVADLFDISMEGNLIAATRDAVCMEIAMWNRGDYRIAELVAAMGGHPTTDYINSGVILLDCDGIRRCGLDAEMVRMMPEAKKFRFPDQDVLNMIFRGRVKFIGHKWNAYNVIHGDPDRPEDTDSRQIFSMRRHLDGDPRILHFAGVAPNPWTPAPRVYFEDAHYLKEFGRDVLRYRETASRLLERVLGPGADVMAEIDFGAL